MELTQQQSYGENRDTEHISQKRTEEKEIDAATAAAEPNSEVEDCEFTFNNMTYEPYYLDISQNEKKEFVAVLRKMPQGMLYFPKESLMRCENEECIYKGTLHSEADCMKYTIRAETKRTVLVHVIEPNVPLSLCQNNQCFLKGKYHFTGQCLQIQMLPVEGVKNN